MTTRGDSSARGKAAKKTEVAHRKARVASLSLSRMTLAEIQAALVKEGILAGLSTLSRDLIQARAEWRDRERVSIAAAQEQELAALARDEARLRGYLGALKQDDHRARVAYQQQILEIMKLRAKILGTEAPQKIEQKIDSTVSDRRSALEALSEADRAQLASLAARAYGPRQSLAGALGEPFTVTLPSLPSTTNGNGAAPH